jgi:hypothetical protein
MCRFKESSEPYRLSQSLYMQANLRSISHAFLLTRLRFVVPSVVELVAPLAELDGAFGGPARGLLLGAFISVFRAEHDGGCAIIAPKKLMNEVASCARASLLKSTRGATRCPGIKGFGSPESIDAMLISL